MERMNLPEREKVIKGLECCVDDAAQDKCWVDGDYKECPYNDNVDGCIRRCIRDALALLKAQEPRVLTLEELRSLPEDPPVAVAMEERVPMYKWDAGSICKWTGSHFVQEEYLDDSGYISAGTYGKIWRVWTDWPNEAQREAEPWKNT